MASDSDWVPWAEVEVELNAMVPEKKAEKAASGPSASKPSIQMSAETLAAFPWAQKYVTDPTSSAASSGAAGSTELDPTASPPDHEESMEEAFNQLLEKRKEQLEDTDTMETDFGMVVRGGRWTKANKNLSFDAFAAQALNEDARAFCREQGLADHGVLLPASVRGRCRLHAGEGVDQLNAVPLQQSHFSFC